jgi:transcriptional regulator with XRE-family HTH domain
MQVSAVDIAVGRRLRVLRISKGHNLDALAAALKIPPERLDLYENGEDRIPPRVLGSAADFLNVSMQAFFDPSHARIVQEGAADAPQHDAAADIFEALELLQNFSKIKDPVLRAEVLNFVAFLSQYP